jgi:hypothetical protein
MGLKLQSAADARYFQCGNCEFVAVLDGHRKEEMDYLAL